MTSSKWVRKRHTPDFKVPSRDGFDWSWSRSEGAMSLRMASV